MNKIATFIEKFIIYALIGMMVIILILATIELGYYLVKNILNSNYLLIDLDNLMDLFGVFLLVLIGIELLDTIKVYLRRNVVHVEVVVLVAIIAIARKVVVLKIEQLSGELIMGIGVLVISLSVAYYLIKKSGLLVCDLNKKEENLEHEKEQGKDE
ncbi:MAG: hypothetical protein A2W99_05120 [Bacteroidetes bacterium GWF2_33_16]|nr:MAG: hypothetical protein A2X00_17640 [Bacteroidetes bacterium GWE2_32_14]OFY06047.1 MAG: hypothetical protein A2W99_05120 [Bacteroidetes bacterium GWF2_33_16]